MQGILRLIDRGIPTINTADDCLGNDPDSRIQLLRSFYQLHIAFIHGEEDIAIINFRVCRSKDSAANCVTNTALESIEVVEMITTIHCMDVSLRYIICYQYQKK